MSKFKLYRKRSRFVFPVITVHNSGHMTLNSATIRKFVLDSEFVALYYDKETQRIGLNFFKESNGFYYKIVFPTNGVAIIGSRGFFSYSNLLPREKNSYKPTWNKEESLLVFDLNDPMS